MSEYRIKPKPLERWMVFAGSVVIGCFETEQAAEDTPAFGRIVHMREVTD